MDARPGYYKKTPIIRHPVHLNGMIYRFYLKPNREVVWKINFVNGHGSPQRYKAVDVVAAVDPMNGIARAPPWLIPQDEDGEDSSLLNSLLPAARRSVLVGSVIHKSLRVWCYRGFACDNVVVG